MKKRVLSLFLAITLCLTLTPTGALAAEEQPPEQTVSVTQEAQIPAPAAEEEEEEKKTTSAENGADENDPPANPEENPTEDAPAAAEKNTADEETDEETDEEIGKETGKETDKEAGKQAVQNEPTVEGENEPLALGLDDPGQNAAEGENGEGSGGTHYVAESGGTQYETVQDFLDNMDEGEITLLDSVTDDLTVYAATTIHMNGHSITGNIDATDNSLTLNDGTVDGTVKVDGGTFTMTAPAEAEAAITGRLKVVSGSAFVSGAKVGVKGTLYFDGTDMLISGAVKAVELDGAAEPAAKTLYGSATVNGDTAAEAGFDTDTYKVGGEIAKKLTNKQVGSTTPAAPSLTLTETSKSLTAGKTAVFTANYTGTDTLNAYVQGSAVNGYFTISQKNNGDGTYTVSVKIDEETPGGTYTLFVHKLGNTSVQASATITVTGLPDAAEVNGKQYKSLPRALDAAQDGDTVKLLADHTTNWDNVDAGDEQMAVVRKTLTLDLNGMTVDYLTVGEVVSDEADGILESYDGNLTVVDNIQGGSHGKIEYLEFVKGSLAIQGGQIGDSNGSRLTCNENSGSVTISGGTVLGLEVGEGDTVAVNGGTVLGLKVSEGATVTVNDGSAHAGNWFNDGTLSITGGAFKDVQFVNSGTIAISGGTFEKISNNDTNTPQPLMLLLAKDCAFVNENNTSDVQDGTKTSLTEVMVKEHTHTFENGKCGCGVASIVVDNNNSCYNTLQAALNAAANNASITSVTLGQDLTENVTFNRSAAGALTLNMNGHKLEAEAGVPLTVIGGELIIEGAGQVNQNTASNANPFPAISLTGGKLVIAGDLTAQGGYNSSNGRKPAIRAEEEGELDLQGNVSLNGGLTILDNAKLTNLLTKGTFYVDASETGNAIAITDNEVPSSVVYKKALELLAKDYAFYRANGSLADAGGFKLRTGTYTIKPHTCSYTHNETYGIAFCNCGRSHAHRDLSEEKSVLVNGICPICGYHCPHNTVDETTLSCSDCGAKVVAKVEVEGSEPTYAFDLASAFQNAVNGTTIKLLANEMLPDGIYASKTLTLDLNGHSLSGYSLNVGGLTPTSQVRTGNLTVIDSSGGNGAVGVTVRDGGTLVFDPKNDHTTLLQLEVWGGTVELHGGKISRQGLRLNKSITLGNLLPQKAGLAYYCGDTQLTLEEAASKTCDLVVKSCNHGGKNGFDENAAACPYCNAPAVAETALNHGEGNRPQRRFADLQTALDADRDGGATLWLLADVTGDYTINGTQDTGLDLNGHSIKGTVTVKAAAGSNTTTLSNTGNTTTASINKVVAYKGAKLAGSGYPAVIGTLKLAEGATWKTILNDTALGYKVLNADGTHKWYARDDVSGSQLNNVIINRLPITSNTLYLKVDGKNQTGSSPKVGRGTTVQLCASCNASGADVSIYIGKTVGNSLPIYRQKKAEYQKIGTSWYYVVDLDANTIGTYDIYFTASKDGYKVTSAHKKLTVTKPNLSNAEITFPYGNEAAFNYVTATGVPTFDVIYKGQTLKKDVDYTIASGDSFSGVGPCTLTIKATDNGDYTGSKSAEWTVRPLKVAASVGDIIKTYDGTTDLPENTKITFKSADSYYTGTTLRLAKGTDYEVSNARYDSADASETEKTVSFTIKLKNAGYVFEDGTTQKDFTLNGADFDDKTFQINKATVPMNNPAGTLNIINGTQQTYTYDFNNILPGLPGGKYGTISYGQADISLVSQSGYYYDETIVEFKKGVLTLAQFYAKDGNMTGKIGTVKVNVTTTNYENFQLKLVLYAVDQIKPTPDGEITAAEITYGDTLSKSEISGKMKDPNTGDAVNGTFTWTNGKINPNAGDYEADWTFTPAAGYEEYATATGTVTVKVKPAKLTVSVKASSMYYTGKEQIASIIASGESVDSTPVTFTYSDKEDGNYTSGGPTFTDAGTYTVYYKAEAANHEPATGTFTVTIVPLPIRLLSVSSISKTYDGSADVTLTADKLTFFSKTANIKLPDTALSFSDAQFTSKQADGSYLPSPEVGGGKALSFTMTLTSKNYVFEGESEGTTEVSDVFATDDANRFTITKATAPTGIQTGTLNVINGTTLKYTYDAKQILPAAPNGTYGTVLYSGEPSSNFESGYTVNSFQVGINNGVLTLTIDAQNGGKTGKIGSVTIYVTTDNYEIFNLPLDLYAVNQIKPMPDGKITASEITYGNELSASTITGTMQDPNTSATVNGTFAWTDGTIKPDAGSYDAEWTFTPAEGYEKYATVTGTVTVKVNKATPTFNAPTAQENLTYTGQAQALITAGSVTSGGTMQYSLTENGKYSQNIPTGTDAGAYTVWYRVIGDPNHNDTEPASVPVRIGKKPLTITEVTAASKTYDGTTNAGITSVTFDNVTLTRDTDYTVTASFDDAGVGSGKNATATVTLMGQTAKNYFLEQSSFPTTGSITAKQVTVTGITAKDKVYDGTTNATLDCSNAKFDGILENDKLTVAAKGMFESADIGEQKVRISDLTLDGDSVANYVLAESGNQTQTTATITAKEVTVTPDNKSKVYEEKDPELTYKVSGVLDGEMLKDITLDRDKGENAGEYAITATADAGANPNYDVTFAEGTLTIEPKSIKGAKVVLGKALTANGAEQTQAVEKVLLYDKELPADSYTVTDNTATAPGSYTLTITGKGNYTGTVKQTYAIAPAKAEDAPGEEIAIGIGKVNVNVQSEGTVPPATLLTDKVELLAMLVDSGDITADELAQIADGASVDIVLTVKEANVPDEVKTAMAQAAKDYTIGQYLDISLFKYMTVNGSQQAGVALHTTKDVLTISVVVPDALINTNSAVNRTYCIVRNHEGTITVLDAAFDAASKTLTFKTDRFSIYAIAYKDTAVPSSGSNPGSNNSSNDSETKKNEVAAPTPAPTPASTSKPSTITTMPQTGDTSNPTLYVVLLVASLLGLAVVFVCKKRNDK